MTLHLGIEMTLKKIVSKILDLNLVQFNLEALVKELDTCVLLEGVLIKDVVLASWSDNQLNHGLDRTPRGFLITRKNANAQIWESDTVNPKPKNYLLIEASATVTASFWVF